MAHKTLINGTSYDIKSGRTLIGGTGYDVKKGRTLIGGTGYDISFGTPISELPIGASVYMNVAGVRKEFIIVNQGNPSSKYNANGTWVLMKDIYSYQIFSNEIVTFPKSQLYKYANETFFQLLSSSLQNSIKTVTVPYDNDANHSVTTNCKIFVLSYSEISTITFPDETLAYFNDVSVTANSGAVGDASTNYHKIIANYNGSPAEYWLRDGYQNQISYQIPYQVGSGGFIYQDKRAGISSGFRPSWVVNFETLVDSDFNVIEE